MTALTLTITLSLTLAAGFPPLSKSQQRQVASATDESRAWDAGPLYPLLRNVSQWKPGELAGAMVPDYAAIQAKPAAHRGEVFLIEGHFVRRRRLDLSRAGPWGEAVTEWAIRVSDEPNRRYVMVFLADPTGSLPHPTKGASVRLAGRFYKVWRSHNKQGRRKNWLTFVANTAKVSGGTGAGPAFSSGMMLAALLALAAMAGLGLVLARLRRPRSAAATEAGPRLGERGYAAHRRNQARQGRAEDEPMNEPAGGSPPEQSAAESEQSADELEPTLPADPDRALGELSREHEAHDGDEGNGSGPVDSGSRA